MNIYRSSEPNQRKPILKPLTTPSSKRRPSHTTDTNVTSDENSTPSIDRSYTSDTADQPSSVTRLRALLAGIRVPSSRLGELVSRRVQLPAWLAVILGIALVAGPIVAIMVPLNETNELASEPLGVAIVEPTATEIPGDSDRRDLDTDGMIDPFFWSGSEASQISNSDQDLLADELDANPDVRYAAEEVERLQGELEAIQRNSSLLRSLAREQSGDLSSAYSSLELTQEDNEGVLADLQGRIDDLEQHIQSVDDLARELRDLVGLPQSESGVGGPRPSNDETDEEDVNPWQALRDDIVYIEHWAGELVFDLDEVNTEIQLRIARLEQAQAEAEAQAQAEAEAQARVQAQSQTPVDTGSSLSGSIEYFDSMPMGWPVEGPITSRFGMRGSPFAGENGAAEMHTGIDISARLGTPVVATGGGTVQIAGDNGGYGLLVVIDHGRGVTSWYGHNSRLLVSPGQRVNAGDVIAEVGSTGRSTGPHVHYEVRTHGVPEDPLPYMQMNR